MKYMRFFHILPLCASAVCLMAQTPPKPPSVTPSLTGPEGVTVPLELKEAPVIPSDRVVIQVGDLKLTAGQVDQILEAYPANQRVFVNGPGRLQFIDQVVRVLLLSEEGKKRKLTETETYKNQLMYSAAGLLAAQTDEEIKRGARGDEALLRAYYEAHKGEYEQVRGRHILVRFHGSPLSLAPGQKDLSEAEAMVKVLELRQKIVQGAEFAEVAKVDSDDMGTSAKGGDMGFVKRGQTVPSFEEALYSMKVGELSQPVKTTYGYHLIKAEERKPTRTFEELRPELERNLEAEASRKFLADLKAKSKIVIDPDFGQMPAPAAGSKQ